MTAKSLEIERLFTLRVRFSALGDRADLSHKSSRMKFDVLYNRCGGEEHSNRSKRPLMCIYIENNAIII